MQGGGDQQTLALDSALQPLGAQALEEHPFVGGMLVDQQQPILGFEYQVGR